MSYKSIAIMAQDHDLMMRITACAAQERKPSLGTWVQRYLWFIASSPGWSEAWDYAVSTQVTDIGNNEAVITDGMILAAVQSMTG